MTPSCRLHRLGHSKPPSLRHLRKTATPFRQHKKACLVQDISSKAPLIARYGISRTDTQNQYTIRHGHRMPMVYSPTSSLNRITELTELGRPFSETIRRNKTASSDVFQSIDCAKRIFQSPSASREAGFSVLRGQRNGSEGTHLRSHLCALGVLRVRPSSSHRERGERGDCVAFSSCSRTI